VAVYVGPGNGTVEIKGLDYYDLTFYYSTISACWEAAIAAGVDPLALNYTVVITPLNASRALVGTSLSLTVAVAAYSAITHTPLNASIIYTGTLAPGGVVDFVGGLVEKAQGARQYGFKLFVYPVLQHYDYKIVWKPKLYGVYGALVERVERRPLPLAEIVPVEEVGNIYQAVAIAAGAAYNLTANLERLGQAAETVLNSATPIDAVEKEALLFVNKTLRLAALYPQYADVLRRGAAQALAYVQVAKNNTDLATEALPRAIAEAATPYFYVRMLTDPQGAEVEIATYLAALLELADAVANNTAPLCDMAYAHMYIHTAQVYMRDAGLDYAYYKMGFIDSAAQAAYKYAQAVYYLWKSLLYYTHSAEPYDIEKAAASLRRYVEQAVRYADMYSKATDIISPQLVGNAALNYARGEIAMRQGNYKAALGYYIEALAYALTYFALHPAFPNTTDVKYLHYLDALSHVVRPDGQVSLRENLAIAAAAPLNETKLLYLARVHACQIAERWANWSQAPAQPHAQVTALPKPPQRQEEPPYAPALVALAPLLFPALRRIQNVHTKYRVYKKHKKST